MSTIATVPGSVVPNADPLVVPAPQPTISPTPNESEQEASARAMANKLTSRERRTFRQRDVIPAHLIESRPAIVIGVGSIGRPLAHMLAMLGVAELHLIDPDLIEEVNSSSQGWNEADYGKSKVEVCAAECRAKSSDIKTFAYQQEAPIDGLIPVIKKVAGSVTFLCTDSITSRKAIVERYLPHRAHSAILIDGRMSAEVFSVFTFVGLWERWKDYEFPQSEAADAPCTARSTSYCGPVAAGFMAAQYCRIIRRRQQVEERLNMNMFAMELSAQDSSSANEVGKMV